MNEPQVMCIARRGQAAIAALILMHTDGNAVLHAFSFTDETIATAPAKAFERLGLTGDKHISVLVFVWDVGSLLDAHVIARFAAAVKANDTAYLYSLANSNGGQA